MWQSYLIHARKTEHRLDPQRKEPKPPFPSHWSGWTWTKICHWIGKQSLWSLLSPSASFFGHLVIHCHSSGWQFLNLELCLWHNCYQHRPNMHSFLPCVHHSDIPRAPSWKSNLWKASLPGGVSLRSTSTVQDLQLNCTELAIFPSEDTKGNYCMTHKFYLVLIWESLCESFHLQNHSDITGIVGNAHCDCSM